MEQRLTPDRLKRFDLDALFGLALVCALIFSGALGGQFLSWDDTHHLQLNPWLTNGDWLHFWKRAYYGFYIPVTYTLWTWMWTLWKEPFAYHLLNLTLHVLNAFLVFKIAPKVFKGIGRGEALVAATIFAVHPVQVEPVAWISGGRDVLSAHFALLACAALVFSRSRALWFLSAALFALSLLSKPQLLTLPLALWLVLPDRRKPLLAWLGLSLAFALLAVLVQNEIARAELGSVDAWKRPLVALDTLGFYLRKLVWPWPLSADYGRRPDRLFSGNLWWPSLLALGLAGALIYRFRARWPLFERGLLFSAIVLLPVLGLVPFSGQEQSTVYDRYLYFAMIGPAVALATIPRGRIPVFGLVLVAWCTLSVFRAGAWASDRALSEDMVRTNPQSYGGLTNLANVELNEGNLDRAIELLKQAIELRPRLSVAISNLAYAYWLKKDLNSIFKEIEPLLEDNEFLASNTTEKEGLALMYRMTARAHWTLMHRDDAKAAYCRAYRLYPIDPYLKAEVDQILNDLGEKCP